MMVQVLRKVWLGWTEGWTTSTLIASRESRSHSHSWTFRCVDQVDAKRAGYCVKQLLWLVSQIPRRWIWWTGWPTPRTTAALEQDPESLQEQIVGLALSQPDQSPRQQTWLFVDEMGYFISESSVYRILKGNDLVQIISVVRGKWTSFRAFSEEVTDKHLKK